MRSMLLVLVAALVVLSGRVPVCAEVTSEYQCKAMNPRHVRELRACIDQWIAKVNSAPDAETRSKYQEELCKKLIQAEDYDNALRAATSIVQTSGINAERRAAHHYLIAQIYLLKMEASPNESLMRANRQAAYAAASEVVNRKYPDRWMVGDAARKLMERLQDPKYMCDVQGWVRKRQSGGDDPEKLAAAKAQSASADRSVGVSSRGRLASIGRQLAPINLMPRASASAAPAAMPSQGGIAEYRYAGNLASSGSRTGAADVIISDSRMSRMGQKQSASASAVPPAADQFELPPVGNKRTVAAPPATLTKAAPMLINGTSVQFAPQNKAASSNPLLDKPWPQKTARAPEKSAASKQIAATTEAPAADGSQVDIQPAQPKSRIPAWFRRRQ